MYQYILAAMDLVLGLREWAYEAESPYISGFHMRDGMQRLKCGGFRLGELAFPSPKDLTCSYPYFAAMLKPRRAGQRRVLYPTSHINSTGVQALWFNDND